MAGARSRKRSPFHRKAILEGIHAELRPHVESVIGPRIKRLLSSVEIADSLGIAVRQYAALCVAGMKQRRLTRPQVGALDALVDKGEGEHSLHARAKDVVIDEETRRLVRLWADAVDAAADRSGRTARKLAFDGSMFPEGTSIRKLDISHFLFLDRIDIQHFVMAAARRARDPFEGSILATFMDAYARRRLAERRKKA